MKRIELAELLRNETDDSTQAISKLNLEIKRSESKFERILPLTFVDQLKKLVQPSENGKGCIDFISSLFQADPEIAGLAISGSVDAIISGDSDFSLHIGPGRMSAHHSRDCSTDSQSVGTDFMLQNPKISIRNSSVESMSLVTGQMFVRDHSQSILNSRVPAEYFPVTPTVPLLNQEKDHMIRMLIEIALGCDVLVGGIKDLVQLIAKSYFLRLGIYRKINKRCNLPLNWPRIKSLQSGTRMFFCVWRSLSFLRKLPMDTCIIHHRSFSSTTWHSLRVKQ